MNFGDPTPNENGQIVEILYDRNEITLVERVCKLRETHQNISVGDIQKPAFEGNVFSIEVLFS